MAITKILARNSRLDAAVNYATNGDKTEDHILTAYLNCDPGLAARQMMETKEEIGKTGGRQCYHIIQSFQPGEVTPELALEIAREFAEECLPGYEAVIGTHVDRHHIHSHIVFNSVNTMTGEKYHIRTADYYKQIRAVSDRLCREHGLSVVMQGERSKTISYVEWLRESRGQPTFRSMLEADLKTAIEDANDLGHFFLLMEHMGWEIRHGNRLGFRLRGQERFMYPGRKNPMFTEDGILAAIQGNLDAMEQGKRPAVVYRPPYRPYRKYRKYKGFLALYVHYLYVLGKIEHREYPPRMTPELKASVMRFEQYRAQFAFLRDNGVTTKEEMATFTARAEDALANLMKQRTILNVRKKKRRTLYAALADAEALAPAKEAYEDGLAGMENEYERYMEAVAALEDCGVSKEALTLEKAGLYEQLAELNRLIRAEQKKLAMCREITGEMPRMEKELRNIETEKEVNHDEHRR
ncbi:MAG: relaxase/mobilization nuclease domain-containing protein [Oscillospiraceae bacterium]|nr:relaxase/mobilization nuclease domain-containing protein [Oscillospiraceae bacterium]